MSVLVLSDLHWGHGGSADEFHVEQVLVDAARILKPQLARLIADHDIKLLALAGDLIHHGTPGEMQQVIGLLSDLPCDAIACLGNHDLMQPGAIHEWNQAIARWPRARLAGGVASVRGGGLRVVAVTNEWWNNEQVANWWSPAEPPIPALDEATYDALIFELDHAPDEPTLLMLHAPPSEAFAGGMAEIPSVRYRQYIDEIRLVIDQRPHVRVAVSGHVHYLAAAEHLRHVVMTVPAANEKPHLGRLFTVEKGELRCRLVNLALPDDSIWRL